MGAGSGAGLPPPHGHGTAGAGNIEKGQLVSVLQDLGITGKLGGQVETISLCWWDAQERVSRPGFLLHLEPPQNTGADILHHPSGRLLKSGPPHQKVQKLNQDNKGSRRRGRGRERGGGEGARNGKVKRNQIHRQPIKLLFLKTPMPRSYPQTYSDGQRIWSWDVNSHTAHDSKRPAAPAPPRRGR